MKHGVWLIEIYKDGKFVGIDFRTYPTKSYATDEIKNRYLLEDSELKFKPVKYVMEVKFSDMFAKLPKEIRENK